MTTTETVELSEEAMCRWAQGLAAQVPPGAIVLLHGPLGAGKTTFVRAFLAAVGHQGPVRSPTFNLVHLYHTKPPIAHIDLYRLSTADRLDLEDLIGRYLLLIEWPDRLHARIDPDSCWQIDIAPAGEKRRYTLRKPT